MPLAHPSLGFLLQEGPQVRDSVILSMGRAALPYRDKSGAPKKRVLDGGGCSPVMLSTVQECLYLL